MQHVTLSTMLSMNHAGIAIIPATSNRMQIPSQHSDTPETRSLSRLEGCGRGADDGA